MAKKPSKKRSDFASAKLYKQWLTRSKASKAAWERKKNTQLRELSERMEISIRGLGHGLTEEEIVRLGVKPNKLRQLEKMRRDIARKVVRDFVPLDTSKMTVKELQDHIAYMTSLEHVTRAELYGEILTRGFVHSSEPEMLRKDNLAIAMQPSRLRHMGEVTEYMLKQMQKAAKKGVRALRKQVNEYAAYFEVPLREVYTLFYSP